MPEADEESSEEFAILKVCGLNYVAKQFGGWSDYDLSDMIEAIDASLEVSGGTGIEFIKQFFLQEHITELSKAGFIEEAGYLRNKMEKVIGNDKDSSWNSMLRMQNRNSELMEHALSGNFLEAVNILSAMEKECLYQDVESVHILAHSCFNIDYLAFMTENSQYIGKGAAIIRKLELFYLDDSLLKIRRVGCRISKLQDGYFHGHQSDNDLLECIKEAENVLNSMEFGQETLDEALNMTWGILLTLKINAVKNNESELRRLINKADEILADNPQFDDVAASRVNALHALHRDILHDRVSHAEVAFKYVEF